MNPTEIHQTGLSQLGDGRRWWLLALFLIVLGVFSILVGGQAALALSGKGSEQYAGSLASHLKADYGLEPTRYTRPGLEPEIIFQIMRDRAPEDQFEPPIDPTQIATWEVVLEAVIPTLVVASDRTPVLTPTSAATSTSTPTPSPSPAIKKESNREMTKPTPIQPTPTSVPTKLPTPSFTAIATRPTASQLVTSSTSIALTPTPTVAPTISTNDSLAPTATVDTSDDTSVNVPTKPPTVDEKPTATEPPKPEPTEPPPPTPTKASDDISSPQPVVPTDSPPPTSYPR